MLTSEMLRDNYCEYICEMAYIDYLLTESGQVHEYLENHGKT